MYEEYETKRTQYTEAPFRYINFNAKELIQKIDNSTLIVNFENDKILKETYKNVRKRGKLQFLKDKKGKFVFDKNGNKTLLKTNGDAIRSKLFQDTFLGKIRDVERNFEGIPVMENGKWKFKKGIEEFVYVVRKPIKEALSKIDDIVDPVIKKLIFDQKNQIEIKDHQGNIIRHVRVKTKSGQVVKTRVNYRSIHDYKNQYYAASGSIPYAVFLQKDKNNRKMLTISSFDIARLAKKHGKFIVGKFIDEFYPDFTNYPYKKLLKVGQKVLVLKNEVEYERKEDLDFQTKRLYIIKRFSEGNIWLKYHLEAQADKEIEQTIKTEKDKALMVHENENRIIDIIEDISIENLNERKDDYERKKYSFSSLNDYRFKRLSNLLGIDEVKRIKTALDRIKKYSSTIEMEGQTPLLKMSQNNWNFLFEDVDFKISLLGDITFIEND